MAGYRLGFVGDSPIQDRHIHYMGADVIPIPDAETIILEFRLKLTSVTVECFQ